MPCPRSFLLLIAVLVHILPFVAAGRTVFRAENLTSITLYDSTAVYLPERCPQTIWFTARARHLPGLAPDKIGIFTREIKVDGRRCKSDASMLDFSPIGPTDHYPPQWVFEDYRFHGHPVNFTCGGKPFSIRFGYFNDVSTEATGGLLRPEVVYLDFAVIPNTRPFAFCSYAGRRSNGEHPLDFTPFPSQRTWRSFRRARKSTHPAPRVDAEEQTTPDDNEDADEDDTNKEETAQNNGQTVGEEKAEETEAPGLDRATSMRDPFR